MTNLLDFSLPELEAYFEDMGEPAFRARQVWQWLWQKGARGFEDMTNVSKPLRHSLTERARVSWPQVVERKASADGTVKFLLELYDGARIETVVIPEKDHHTLCASTQAGCAMGCLFCSTGGMGFTRNLSMGEILGQYLVARADLAGRGQAEGLPLRNVVLMGMGEPLLNLDNVVRALTALHDPTGLGVSRRRITLSTVGLPEPLLRFGATGLASLAVSLHAPTQELRERLMPKAARVPLEELIEALARYPLQHRERITIEYILLGGVNDDPWHARELNRLVSKLKVKVNCIVYNPPHGEPVAQDGLVLAPPAPERVEAFMETLRNKGLNTVLRKSKGQDIAAACGQLKVLHDTEA